MRRHSLMVLTLTILLAVVPYAWGQWPAGMRYQGLGTIPSAIATGAGTTAGFGYGGYSPFVGVLAPPYMGGYGYGGYAGYDPTVASVPSAAYFTYGRTSYTTESPSPLRVYGGARPPYGPMPAALPLTALLKVQVPENAEIWLEGQKMRSIGAQRHYRSPPLDPAKDYVYEVRARWLVDGKPYEDVRHVAIRAGATIAVDFTHLDPLIPRPSLPPEMPKAADKNGDSGTPPASKDKPAR
jgi:uncharacterized protein (TIGR03000 family)